jgi:glutaredoxin
MSLVSGSLLVTLYGKPGCHLCEQAEALLQRLQTSHPHTLRQVDVETDDELLGRYQFSIPVVEIAGREYPWPLTELTLKRALAEAARA